MQPRVLVRTRTRSCASSELRLPGQDGGKGGSVYSLEYREKRKHKQRFDDRRSGKKMAMLQVRPDLRNKPPPEIV
jgi:hypothetical protein